MPKSRKRKPRRKPTPPRRRRVATVRPGQDVDHLITEDDVELLRAEIDAGARGDALAAYNFQQSGLQVEGGRYPFMLRELVVLGEEAPPWMYSRWCLDLAYRWMLVEHDTRVDDAVKQLMLMAHWDLAEPLLDDPVAFAELGTRIAAGDRLCEELALHEYGGIYDYIDIKAENGLLDRCDHVVEWAFAELGGYVIKDAVGPLLRVVDLADNGEIEVLNIGALADRERDEPVIGRLGPISSGPGLMFQKRPISVDLETAQGVANSDGPQDDWPLWVPAVTNGCHQGRLPSGFSVVNHTLYSSDILPMDPELADHLDEHEPPGRLVELRAAGLDDFVANGVMLAEFALIAVEVSGADAVSAVGPHLATVLVEPRVVEALRLHCVAPEHEHHWDILAAGSIEPVRSRCTELARLCREAA
ncbi:hypothetical protein [Nocardioides dilutus]